MPKSKSPPEKPWSILGITRERYVATKPWKKAGVSKEKFAEILNLLPNEVVEVIKEDSETEMLVKEFFGQPGDNT
ncbi:hypothetical protein [Desulfonatronum thioautotrophicum]|uniref:hypothetical protein n=1 Tax=Desulfonatronum thioautotrophicum TaxID=617001 RepID=UPI0005EBDA66|nr:hypothetical protein [Desulfonatronum thioautotrophicum]